MMKQTWFTIWLSGPSEPIKYALARHLAEILESRGTKVEILNDNEAPASKSHNTQLLEDNRDGIKYRIDQISRLNQDGVKVLILTYQSYNTMQETLAKIKALIEVRLERETPDPSVMANIQDLASHDVITWKAEEPVEAIGKRIIGKLESLGWFPPDSGYSLSEEEQIEARLKALGYL
jgi:hypothetical protein